MKNLLKTYYPAIILLVFLLLFLKLMHISYSFYNNRTKDSKNSYVSADNSPIKVEAKYDHNYAKNNDKELYNFVSQKDWKLEASKGKQEIKPIKTHELNLSKNTNKPLINDVINLENHTIRIIEKKQINKKQQSNKNTLQLGAYATIEKAEQEKYRIMNLYEKQAKKHHFYLEKAAIKDKGTIYRLKVGPFSNSTLAKSFCDNLRKKAIECFMTVN